MGFLTKQMSLNTMSRPSVGLEMPRTAWGESSHIVDEVLEQILKLPRAIGLFPFSDKLELSLWRLMISVPILLFYGYALITFSICSKDVRYVAFVFENLGLYSCYLTCWIAIGSSLLNISHIESIRKVLNEVEFIFHLMGIEWSYKTKWFYTNLNLIPLTLIFIWNCYSIYYGDTGPRMVLERLGFALAVYGMNVFLISILNQMRGLLSLTATLMSHIRNIRDGSSQVKINEKLWSVMDDINDYFGTQMFFMFNGLVLHCTFLLYLSFRIHGTSVLIFITCHSFFSIFILLHILTAITKMQNEEKKITKFLYRKLNAYPNDEILQFHLIAKRSIVFSAGGFYDLENSLLCSAIEVGTTYLVIQLQYA